MELKKKYLVLGVGNPLRRDDGIGLAVIARLHAEGSLTGVDVRDGGTDGLALLDVIPEYERVVIVDAVEMGAPPGTLRVFGPEEARFTIQTDALSTHGFGLADVLALMPPLGITSTIRIIGVQAKEVAFGEGLSQDVARQMDAIVTLIKKEIINDKDVF